MLVNLILNLYYASQWKKYVFYHPEKGVVYYVVLLSVLSSCTWYLILNVSFNPITYYSEENFDIIQKLMIMQYCRFLDS